MWLLIKDVERRKSSLSENNGLVLTTGVHVVGRKDCRVLIHDDASISRKHSVITVQHDQANLGDPCQMSQVFLEDFSKYGTFINGIRITGTVNVKSGDELLFGKNNSLYRLQYIPLVVVTSCLDEKKKNTLKSHVLQLGGHMINDWRANTVTHLVMDGLTFTIKVIHALAECCPIVTPSYFDDIINSTNAGPAPLPVESSYLPPLKEETISSQGASFLPREARKSLFHGKTFIFISKKQYKRLQNAVGSSGGIVLLRDVPGSESDDGLVSKDVCVMMMDSKEQNSLPTESQKWVLHVVEALRRHGCRPIPESEIGLALLFVSLDKYCNPSITAVPTLTQNLVSQSFQAADIMSQQMVANYPKFKKPITPVKHVRQDKSESVSSVKETGLASTTVHNSLKTKRCSTSTSEPDVINESLPESQTDNQERPPSTKRRKLLEPEQSPIGRSAETALVPDSIDINKSTDETLSNLQLKLTVADSLVSDSLEIKDGTDCENDEEPKGTEHIGHEMIAAIKTENIPDSLDGNPDHFIAGETADTKRKPGDAQPEEIKIHVEQQETNKENRRWPVNEQHFDSRHVQAGFLCSKMPRKVVKETCEDGDAHLPRDLFVVEQVSLVVRRPANVAPTAPKRPGNTTVKNFKKFAKQVYPGSSISLPRIIGGSDLEVYQSSDRLERDEWFLEAREVDAERQREERRAEELFRWEERPVKKRKTKR